MKVIKDYIEFRTLTKPVRDDFDLELIPDGGLGRFNPGRLNELEEYCLNNPQYHIMSSLPSAIQVNRVLHDARFYLLAEGDADPNLWYCDSASQVLFEYSLIRKFDGS